MNPTHTPTASDALCALLHLVDRAERGALALTEAALLRRGIRSLADQVQTAQRARHFSPACVPAHHTDDESCPKDTSTLAERLATAAQLAGALSDYLPDQGRHLADALRRLCAGEMTPAQSLDHTDCWTRGKHS